MNAKKSLSIVAATMCALSSISMNAFAANGNTTTGSKTLESDAAYKEQPVDANLPGSFEAYINPFKASVGAASATTGIITAAFSAGVISPTYYVENKSTAAGLKVSITPTITASKTVSIATKPLKGKETEKLVFAFVNTTTATSAASTPLFLDTEYLAKDNQIVFQEEGVKKDDVFVLDKDGSTAAPTVGYFRVEGDSTAKPEEEWKDSDTVKMEIILNLVPSAGEEKNVLADKISGGSLGSAVSVYDKTTGKATATSIDMKATGSKAAISVVVVDLAEAKLTGTTLKAYIQKQDGTWATGTLAASTGTYAFAAESADWVAGQSTTIVIENNGYSKSYTINFT